MADRGRRELTTATLLMIAITTIVPVAAAEDWPEWRGAGRRGVWQEGGILERFPEGGLEVVWQTAIGSGYSGPAVAGGRVFVSDFEPGERALEGRERLHCLDEASGETRWSYVWPVDYRGLMQSYAIGPRATPTVDGERVYVVGATGRLFALSVETGEVIWHKDFVAELGTDVPTWGVTSAPLVDGELLITVAGAEPNGKVVAFDKTSGREVWRALSSDWEMGYGQPLIVEAGGVRQLIIWHPKALSALDPRSGRVYWEEPWQVGSGMTVATPVFDDHRLLVTQFYYGSLLVELGREAPTAKRAWARKGKSELPDQTDSLHALITTPILDGDTIYGVCSYGELRALDARSGERLWQSAAMTRQGRWGTAFMVRHGDRYFVNNDLGELIIARFSRDGYVEVDRAPLIEPTSEAGIGPRRTFGAAVNWSHPAYANGHVVARNDREIRRVSLLADAGGR